MKKIFSLFAVALMSASMFADPNIVTPTISGETEFTDSVIVTMSCPSPNADIYYTTDGTTDPKCDCAAAPEYKKPIIIRETTVIKAAAYDGNDWSGVAEVTFTKVAARPDTAMGKPAHEEADVMALYCNHYATNNLHFTPQSWSGVAWETLKLGEDSTNVAYTTALTWDGFMGATDSVDLSAYAKLHFDIWVPDSLMLDFTIEAKAGFKHGIQFKLNPGWNTIDADPAWWNTESITYDWKNVKCFIIENYMYRDSTSAEGSPLAIANVYFWNEPAVVCPDAPADPTMAESKITALFAHNYKTNTLAFTPTSWGAQWVSPEGYEGAYFYTASFGWDCFTNWGASSYDLSAYDMFSCDIWVELDSKIKIGFESLKIDDGGTRNWKQGAHFDLQGNQWNHVEVDLLNAPYTTDNYDFTDMRYLVLDGFLKPDGTSAEGTPVGITNAYFWNSMDQGVENVDAEKVAVKRLIDGRLIIEKNGVRYNAQGTQF